MGMIRGALVTVFTILLFLSLFSSAIFLTMSMSLNLNVIKPEIEGIVDNLIRNQTTIASDIDRDLVDMQVFCQNNTELTRLYLDFPVTIPCETVSQGSESIIAYTIGDLVEKNYYKEYDCNFRDCFSEEGNPFFLISKHSKDYWNGWFIWSLIISIVFSVLIFVFMESRNNLPFLLGILFIMVSLPLLGMGKLLGLLIGWESAQIFGAFFTKSYTTFLIFLVLGVIAIGLGLVLKFLSVGRFISKIFKKDKKVSKEELKEGLKEVLKEDSESKKSKKSKKK
jgi:hypothetical protein